MAKKVAEKRKPGRPAKKVEEVENKKEKRQMTVPVAIALIVAVIFLSVLTLIKQGTAGVITSNLLSYVFGNFYWAILITLLFYCFRALLFNNKERLPGYVKAGVFILNLAIIMLSSLLANHNSGVSFSKVNEIIVSITRINSVAVNYEGGIVGTSLYAAFTSFFNAQGALAVNIALFVVSAILIIPLTYFKKAAVASKTAVVNTANSIGEAKAHKEEKKRIEKEEARRQRDQRIIASINENISEIGQDIAKEENPVEYIDNVSEFSKKFFLGADEEPLKKPEHIENKEDTIDETAPHASTHIQTSLEDANEPKLTSEHQTLRRVSNFKNYKLPNPQTLLTKAVGFKSNKNEQTAEARGHELIKILAVFGIKAQLIDYHIGPSVTKFEIKPDASVNLSKINSLADNIKMGLAATSIRIEAPIPGKNAVGVEVPNAENTPVRMSELITNIPKDKVNKKLLFALGKDLSGTPEFCDLAKMPHLLIAGATGSGKSVCINTIITSYLLRTKPDEVKLILVDPKKVEFTPYHDIPHLLWPVITDAKMASLMLKKMVVEMERRYDAFAKAAVKDITSYNEKVLENNKNLKEGQEPMAKLPYIVVIIDELADMMQTAKNEVESSITRITQLARASGIHLIVATQRPSTDVITGLIKSNIPSRISFAVSSAIDSRTILDQTGAEDLLGNGDMLYAPQGENTPKRLQGCWVTDAEIEAITSYVKQQAKPEYDDTYFALQESNSSGGSNATSGEEDDIYSEAVDFVAKTKKASTSSLQRRFGIGYNRAARLIDTMEENGLIGPSNGSKPREVYVRNKDEQD